MQLLPVRSSQALKALAMDKVATTCTHRKNAENFLEAITISD